MNSKYIFLSIFGIIISACFSDCSSSRSLNQENQLQIIGMVRFPRGNPVPFAKVETEPPTQKTLADSSGVFVIDQGLQVGRYRILAEQKDDKGSVIYNLAYGKVDTIIIRLGSNIKFEPKALDPTTNETPDHSGAAGDIQTIP